MTNVRLRSLISMTALKQQPWSIPRLAACTAAGSLGSSQLQHGCKAPFALSCFRRWVQLANNLVAAPSGLHNTRLVASAAVLPLIGCDAVEEVKFNGQASHRPY